VVGGLLFARILVVQGSRAKAGDAAAQWGAAENLGSRVGHGPAGAVSLLGLIILPAVLCCFQLLVDGAALHSIDVPGV